MIAAPPACRSHGRTDGPSRDGSNFRCTTARPRHLVDDVASAAMPWYIRRATTPPCHTTSVDFPLPLHQRHAMPRHATPRHAMPCHAMSLPLCPYTSLQPIDCWSTWPRKRHRVNVRTQLMRSTSLAYSLTISRTRHRRRRRSTGIYNLSHQPPSTMADHRQPT